MSTTPAETFPAAVVSAAPLWWVEAPTLGDLVVRAAALFGPRDAVVFPNGRRTYAELLDAGVRAARSLLGLGVRPGDRVAILMPNCFAFLDVLLGCQLVGISVLPVNARFRTRELGHVLRDSEAVAVVTTDLASEYTDFVELLRDSIAGSGADALRHLVMLGDSSPSGFVDQAAFAAAADAVPAEYVHTLRERVRLGDEAMLMYTSGTTADPKGVVHAHESLVRTALAAAERWRLTAEDRFWNPLPLFHIGGTFPLWAHMHVGATVVTSTRFEPGEALALIGRERCTYLFPAFPTITQPLLHHPDFERADLSHVRYVLDCSPPEITRDVEARIGAPVVKNFAMTELAGGATWGAPDDPYERRMETGGLPFRGTEVRVVDAESDVDVPVGERGEILVRGPGLFQRYLNDPEKTAEAMRGGWFHTGDLGRLDPDGRLTYLGRLKDMLKVGGENVAAVEIEAHLGTHPSVLIAQVVGIPDTRFVEVPAAFVEPVGGATVTEAELIDHCRGAIASFKVPRHVRFVDEWPMSGTKIQKFRLREALISELGLAGP